MADYLSAQGSGLRPRQTKESPHAPEIATPTPAVNLRFDIDRLAQGLEAKGSLSVGKDEKKPEQFPLPRGCVRTWSRPQAGRRDAYMEPQVMMMMFITIFVRD